MKTITLAAALALASLAAPAMAWEGKTVACFNKEWVPPTYSSKKTLIKEAKELYEHKNGRIELVRYPAVYRVDYSAKSEGHFVMKKVSCYKH